MGSLFDRHRAVFASLGVRNYRRFWLGQAGSLIGTYMQLTALTWLILSTTGSAAAVGWLLGLQRAPLLLLGPYAGLVVDRFDTRRLMIVLQSVMFLLALLLTLLTVGGLVRPWHVYLYALLLGACDAFELPARNVLTREIVGDDLLVNALSLNGVTANVATLVGPAVAGVLIATAGEGWCFVINTTSFLGLLVALLALDGEALEPSPVVKRAPGQLREGLRYAARTPTIAVPLLMAALVYMLGFQLPVSLAPLAEQVLRSGSQGFGSMGAAVSAGAIVGGLFMAGKGNTGLRGVTIAAGAVAPLMLLAAIAPTLPAELLALALLGVATISFFITGRTTVELAAPPEMRARVAALNQVAFGLSAIGAPVVGWIVTQAGPRTGLAVGAGTFLLAAAIGLLGIRAPSRDAR